MIQDCELRLKDLCARLPYGVMVQHPTLKIPYPIHQFHTNEDIVIGNNELGYYLITIRLCKPYLRPMSSMTEEERKEIGDMLKNNRISPFGKINDKGCDDLFLSCANGAMIVIDWLNAYHFDYRGLIEKEIAIEATEGMYDLN